MSISKDTHFAFLGTTLVVRGTLSEVVTRCKECHDAGTEERIAVFDEERGHIRDVDYSGTLKRVLQRLDAVVLSAKGTRSRGRPKLGVLSREIGLLPRHWEWLSEQRGGASATLRRLVEQARKNESGESIARRAMDAAHSFMWDIASDQPGFEEVTRHLYASELEAFAEKISDWPEDIRGQLMRYQERAIAVGA